MKRFIIRVSLVITISVSTGLMIGGLIAKHQLVQTVGIVGAVGGVFTLAVLDARRR